MLPAPITIATSTPVPWTSAISAASASTVGRSRPYSRSPISDSPETFRRTRRNATARSSSVSAGAPAVTPSVSQGDALERNDLGTGLGQSLGDRLRGVLDQRLFDQHAGVRAKEALLEDSLD